MQGNNEKSWMEKQSNKVIFHRQTESRIVQRGQQIKKKKKDFDITYSRRLQEGKEISD